MPKTKDCCMIWPYAGNILFIFVPVWIIFGYLDVLEVSNRVFLGVITHLLAIDHNFQRDIQAWFYN